MAEVSCKKITALQESIRADTEHISCSEDLQIKGKATHLGIRYSSLKGKRKLHRQWAKAFGRLEGSLPRTWAMPEVR